mgnify:CR=1 FL=1
MSEKRFCIVGLGEVLWDCLPGGNRLGGAPGNFAYIAAQLGDRGIIASRVGNDADGKEIVERLRSAGVETDSIQVDEDHQTGTVKVELDDGQPSYEIRENAAWDFLELTADLRDLALQCDAVCFGTLAQRSTISRKSIHEFLSLTTISTKRVFDINLRQSYFSKDIIKP